MRDKGEVLPHPENCSITNHQQCDKTNSGREKTLRGLLRETSVLGLGLAGRGEEGKAFVTVVIEGEGNGTEKLFGV